MASTDARPVPKKNTAYRHYFAIRKNDGTLITTWAGMDSERSLDGATFADCTNEATEIGTTGIGYIDLTATEMNTDATVLKVTVTNTDALPYVVTLFPEEAGDIRTNVTQISDDATAADTLELFVETTTSGVLQAGSFAANSLDGKGDWNTTAPPHLLQSTTIATLASQTEFTLTAGSTDDDAYQDAMVIVTDSATATQKAVGTISNYVGSSRTVTLLKDPGVFTMATGDTVDVVAVPKVVDLLAIGSRVVGLPDGFDNWSVPDINVILKIPTFS